ncbi:aspartate kinase [Clostridium botulinum]|nr:aspartate kinase [Clostridium botulinum]MBY6865888.1 aspartate kinase [Clostridium botulinum]MBY6906171.1 aspartate kinase [Clostridium botulinum]MBY6927623.1 aspartate kinase [Clostridium botulinum]MBY6955215.1 aspartate kinase [Clostridium botulinum]
MTLVQRKKLEKVLKKFNDEEMGGGYLYFLHRNELIQLDLVDYSSVTVCKTEEIENFQFIKEDKEECTNEGLYIEIEDEEVQGCWIDEMGCQF